MKDNNQQCLPLVTALHTFEPRNWCLEDMHDLLCSYFIETIDFDKDQILTCIWQLSFSFVSSNRCRARHLSDFFYMVGYFLLAHSQHVKFTWIVVHWIWTSSQNLPVVHQTETKYNWDTWIKGVLDHLGPWQTSKISIEHTKLTVLIRNRVQPTTKTTTLKLGPLLIKTSQQALWHNMIESARSR